MAADAPRASARRLDGGDLAREELVVPERSSPRRVIGPAKRSPTWARRERASSLSRATGSLRMIRSGLKSPKRYSCGAASYARTRIGRGPRAGPRPPSSASTANSEFSSARPDAERVRRLDHDRLVDLREHPLERLVEVDPVLTGSNVGSWSAVSRGRPTWPPRSPRSAAGRRRCGSGVSSSITVAAAAPAGADHRRLDRGRASRGDRRAIELRHREVRERGGAEISGREVGRPCTIGVQPGRNSVTRPETCTPLPTAAAAGTGSRR